MTAPDDPQKLTGQGLNACIFDPRTATWTKAVELERATARVEHFDAVIADCGAVTVAWSDEKDGQVYARRLEPGVEGWTPAEGVGQAKKLWLLPAGDCGATLVTASPGKLIARVFGEPAASR
ncbi:MAG TPA: hypothetical protein VM686_28180 [Polyangiaceae bacterium]|nr:hypothetical protein [Polyangiaceae bacterium]